MTGTNSANPNWIGGRITDERGYVYLRRPDHPLALKKGYVAEHRLVMSECLGRMLEPNEVVHHINGDRSDNRPENLVVLKRAEHTTEHFTRDKHPRWKGGGADLTCLQCGKTFNVKDHNRNEKAKYCSYACYWASMRGPTRVCPTCEEEFQPSNPGTQDQKYCSRHCYYHRAR